MIITVNNRYYKKIGRRISSMSERERDARNVFRFHKLFVVCTIDLQNKKTESLENLMQILLF